MQVLRLSFDRLTGVGAAALGNPTALHVLSLDDNQLIGEVQAALWPFAVLKVWSLSD